MISIATILSKYGGNRRSKIFFSSLSSTSSGRRPDLAQGGPNSIGIRDVENLILFFRYFGPDMDTIFKFFSNHSSIDRRTSSQLRDLYYYENCDWMSRIFRGIAGVAFTQSVMITLSPIIRRDSFTNIIDRAFTWAGTPEGYEYWQRLHRLFGIFYRNVVPEIEDDINFQSMSYMDDVILSKITREFGDLARNITYHQTFGRVYHSIETEAPVTMDPPDLAQTNTIRTGYIEYNPIDDFDRFVDSFGTTATSASPI